MRIRLPRAALAAALLGLAGAATGAAPLPIELVDPATGQTVRVAPGAKALHLVFFATWCSPCAAEVEDLTELESLWRDGGYRLVLVAVASRHTAERLARHAREHDLPGQLLFDATGAAEKSLGADGLPTHIVLDAAGKEVARSGALDDRIRDAVSGLVRAGRARSQP
jgi:thiol-disulfide isomerase/thioredoxin